MLLAVHLVGCSGSGEQFEGEVVYEIRLESNGNAQGLKQMMPKSFTYQIKGKDVRVLTKGGMMGRLMPDVLYKNAGEQTIYLDTVNAVAIDLQMPPNAAPPSNAQVETTEETREIHGYSCTKYIARDSMAKAGATRTLTIWATDQIDAPTLNEKTIQNVGSPQILKQIEGFPLVVEEKVSSANKNMVVKMIAASVTETALDEQRFAIPQGYTTKEMAMPEFQLYRLKQLGLPTGPPPGAQQGQPKQQEPAEQPKAPVQ